MLFSVNIGDEEGYLYFLFEHKSFQEKDIAFQLLDYMQQIWSRELTKEKAKAVPIIIPLVFYHGKRRWTDVKTIGNWITGYDNFIPHMQRYVPDFDFILFDLSFEGQEKVEGNPKLRAYLELSRHIFVRELETFLSTLASIERMLSEYDVSFLDTLFIYILSTRDDVSVETIKERLTTKGGERMMSIAEQLRHEGEERGKEIGKEIGELNKAREMAKKLFLLNMDEEQVIEVTELSAEEIAQIKKELKR